MASYDYFSLCAKEMYCATGRCSAAKIMLADQGQQWKDIVVNFEDWMKGDLKATCVSEISSF